MGLASEGKDNNNYHTSAAPKVDEALPAKTAYGFHHFLKSTAVHLFLIAIVGLISYSNTFQVPFVFDDIKQIERNQMIRNLDNFILALKGYDFSSSAYKSRAYEYIHRRFVGYLSFALNYHFGGLDVKGYHLTNLFIHIANALLVYFLVLLTFRTPYFSNQQTTISRQRTEEKSRECEVRSDNSTQLFTMYDAQFIALFSALLFVAHPIQTQAVTYIVQRLTSLATLFYLLSLVTYIKGRLKWQRAESKVRSEPAGTSIQRRTVLFSMPYALCSLLFAVLAMKTKEIAFTLPFIVILYDFTFFGSAIKKKSLFLLSVLLTLVIIPASIIGTGQPLGKLLSDISENTRVQTDIPRWDYLMTQMRVITTYIRLLFLPADQNLDYDYPIYHSLFTPSVLLSVVFLSAIFGGGVYFFYSSRPSSSVSRLTAFGILWFFITLSVESSVIPIADVIFEHRVYLPSVGAFISIVTAAFMIAFRWSSKQKTVVSILFLIITALSATTFARNGVWQDPLTLWQDVVNKSPNKETGYGNLGLAYAEKGQYKKAIDLYDKVITLKPSSIAFNNRGDAFEKMGQLGRAIADFDRAIYLDPSYSDAYYNRGIAYGKAGLLDKAIESINKSLEIAPNRVDAYVERGINYFYIGQYYKALEDFNMAIQLNPTYALPYYNRAKLYSIMGYKKLAVSDYREACNLGNLNACNILQRLRRGI